MSQEQPQEQSTEPEFSRSCRSPEEWAIQLERLFGALETPFENEDGKRLAFVLGNAIAKYVPAQGERLKLWRMLFELVAKLNPMFPNGNLQIWAKQWKEVAADRDLVRSVESRAGLGESLILATNLLELAARKMDLIDGATVYSKGLDVPFSMNTSGVGKRMRELKLEMERC